MRNNHAQKKSVFNSLVAVFMAAVLGGEATHYSEHHNPHGNRRERIEEMRVRLTESVTGNKNALRNINMGGGPEPDPEPRVMTRVLQARSRVYGVDRV